MAYTVVIQGSPISLPETSASPNWAAGQIEFNKAVASALQFAVGTFDVPPQTYSMLSNGNTNVDIGSLSFPTSQIRSVVFYYNVFRTTSLANEAEAGQITYIYNPNNPPTQKWEGVRQFVGNSTVTFAMSDNGQISFSSDIISGSNHVGTIGFYAKVIQQAY